MPEVNGKVHHTQFSRSRESIAVQVDKVSIDTTSGTVSLRKTPVSRVEHGFGLSETAGSLEVGGPSV
jgi:hypothetical protein